MEHQRQALGVGQRPLDEDQGEQAGGHGTGQQPARARRRGRVMGMPDQADHPGAGRRDRQRDGEMAHHPVRQRDTVGSGQPASHQIEQSWGGGEEGAGQDDRGRHAHAGHIAGRGCQELRVVPTILPPACSAR